MKKSLFLSALLAAGTGMWAFAQNAEQPNNLGMSGSPVKNEASYVNPNAGNGQSGVEQGYKTGSETTTQPAATGKGCCAAKTTASSCSVKEKSNCGTAKKSAKKKCATPCTPGTQAK